MIAIFDSGIGGVSILRPLRGLLPKADILYFGDTAYMPYGKQPPKVIFERISQFILKNDDRIDLYVIACNSATVSLIDDYRKLSSKPFVGIEPGIKPAVAASKNKHICVLATERTCASPQLDRLIERFAAGARVDRIACAGLAEAIERDPASVNELVQQYCAQVLSDADTIVLACTHFPLIIDAFTAALPEKTIIDVSAAVAQQVACLYTNQPNLVPGSGTIQFSCSGNRSEFIQAIRRVAPELNPTV